MRRLLAIMLLCSGCDRVLQFAKVGSGTPPDAGVVCMSEPFDGTSLDTSVWGEFTSATTLSVDNALVATYATTATGSEYSGVFTTASYDFTDGLAAVELVMAPQNSAEVLFSLPVTGMPSYQVAIQKSGGTLRFRYETPAAGVTFVRTVGYDSTQHRYLRIKHDAAADMVSYQTSSDDVTWVEQATMATPFAVTSLYVQLVAGTYQAEPAPGQGVLDNVLVVAPSCAVARARPSGD